MFKKLKLFSVAGLMLAALLTGCGSSDSESAKSGEDSSGGESEKTYKIGITQILDHPSLNKATEGFKRALEEAGLNVEYDEQNAQGDQNNANTIANNFVGDNVDLIFANSTPSAQAALNATSDIPVVFTSVTDPVDAGLVESFENPGGNATGTSDMFPDSIEKTVEFIANEYGAKKIGTIYNTGEQNSINQINQVKAAIEKFGLDPLEESAVATTADVKTAAESLVGKVDVFYIITDNTVVSALDAVIQVAEENKIPLFVGETDSVEAGAFAAFGIDYEQIGYEAGKMAVQILTEGKSPSEIAVQPPSEAVLRINKAAAEKMGVELKEEWNDIAEFIE